MYRSRPTQSSRSRNPIFALCALLLACIASPGISAESELTSVDELDLYRYAGKWFEIARLPNYFERKCANEVTAEYSVLPDDTIQVINSCTKADGERMSAEALARTTEREGQLKVAFAPSFLRWLPFVWADYWVIRNDDYQLAVVSEPGRKYLWILSRQPHPKPSQIEEVLTWLESEGFNTAELIFVPPNEDPGQTP